MLARHFGFRIVMSQIYLRKYAGMWILAAYQHAVLVDHERPHHVSCTHDHKFRGNTSLRARPGPRHSLASRSRLAMAAMRTEDIIGADLFAAMTAEDPGHHRSRRRR